MISPPAPWRMSKPCGVIVLSSTDVPAVSGLRKELDIFDRLGVKALRHFVLNRSDARVGLLVTLWLSALVVRLSIFYSRPTWTDLDLYGALQPLDAITGKTTADDILNRIFSTFCIGK